MRLSASRIGIGIMCKPPRVGLSKTRLAQAIGAAPAAQLAGAFLQDTAATLASAGDLAGGPRIAFFRPLDAAQEITAIIGEGWTPLFCDAGDLGASMFQALDHLLLHAPGGALLVGADLPTLPLPHIAQAIDQLRAADDHTVVIGPSTDGGYYLIGIKSRAAAPLFAPMAWSTPDVLAQTLQRAKEHGLRILTLPPCRDIDEAADIDWLRTALQTPDLPAPATRAALAALGKTVRP